MLICSAYNPCQIVILTLSTISLLSSLLYVLVNNWDYNPKQGWQFLWQSYLVVEPIGVDVLQVRHFRQLAEFPGKSSLSEKNCFENNNNNNNARSNMWPNPIKCVTKPVIDAGVQLSIQGLQVLHRPPQFPSDNYFTQFRFIIGIIWIKQYPYMV